MIVKQIKQPLAPSAMNIYATRLFITWQLCSRKCVLSYEKWTICSETLVIQPALGAQALLLSSASRNNMDRHSLNRQAVKPAKHKYIWFQGFRNLWHQDVAIDFYAIFSDSDGNLVSSNTLLHWTFPHHIRLNSMRWDLKMHKAKELTFGKLVPVEHFDKVAQTMATKENKQRSTELATNFIRKPYRYVAYHL